MAQALAAQLHTRVRAVSLHLFSHIVLLTGFRIYLVFGEGFFITAFIQIRSKYYVLSEVVPVISEGSD